MTEFDNITNEAPRFIFRKERDFGEIISDTFSFFSQNYKVIINILLKYISPFMLLTVFGNVLYQYKTGDLLSDFSILENDPEFLLEGIGKNLFVFLIFITTSILSTVAIYTVTLHIIKSYISNNGKIEEVDIKKGLKQDFIKTLGFLLLFGIVCGIGFVFCFLPGVYFYITLFTGISILIFEEISISDAFSKCFKIIKSNWWITFATVLVFMILIGIINFVFQLPIFIYTFVETFTIATETPGDVESFTSMYQSWVYLLFTAIGAIGQYFLTIFTIIMSALVYFNLSEKHDFTGTYERIDNIGN